MVILILLVETHFAELLQKLLRVYVGYAEKQIPANKFKQCGAQFQDIATETLLADKVLGGLPGVAFDKNGIFTSTAPQIQIVGSDGTPSKYWFLTDGYVGKVEGKKVYAPGWCDVGGNIVNLELDPGSGFWVKNGDIDDQNLQGSGQVAKADYTEITVPANIFSIQANVYPMDINMANEERVMFPDIVGVAFDKNGIFTSTAPQIQIVADDGTPSKYWYLTDGYVGKVEGKKVYAPGWCDVGGNIVDVDIPAQSGFWVKAASGAFTVKYIR